MYISRVHRIQETDISFNDADYDDWKMANPKEKHSHEKYVEMMMEMILEEDMCWTTSSAEIVCIVFTRDDRE
jgi:hypothetical protein